MAATAPDRAAAHRAGPVEDEDGRRVQRCLRCDSLLRIVVTPGKRIRDPLAVGDYVHAERACRGSRPSGMLEYEDE